MSPFSLADVFIGMADRHAGKPAIVSRERTLSYAEFAGMASRTARALERHGLRPNATVGIALRDPALALTTMLGVWMAGSTAVMTDFRSTMAERRHLADDLELDVFLEDRPFPDAPYPSLRIDAAWMDIVQSMSPPERGQGHAPALISLTSGTTGRPQGLVIDHYQLLARHHLRSGYLRTGQAGRMLLALPISSSSARNHALGHLLSGGTVEFLPPLTDSEELAEAVLRSRASFVHCVPTIIRGLLDRFGDRSQPLFPDVETLYCGTSAISAQEKLRALACLSPNYLEVYSSSSTGTISLLAGDDVRARPETVGRVVPHVRLQIVGDDDTPLPAGEVGHIRVRSPGMALGLRGVGVRGGGDRFTDGWAYPGDLGRRDEQGFLEIAGRASDLIIRGGVNVHPAEVEAAILGCANVRDVAVVGFSSGREGEEIAAFVVGSADLRESDIVACCRRGLSPDKRPRIIRLVDTLPRNAAGKTLRAQLRAELEREAEPDARGAPA